MCTPALEVQQVSGSGSTAQAVSVYYPVQIAPLPSISGSQRGAREDTLPAGLHDA